MTKAGINSRVGDALPPCVGLFERSKAGVTADEKCSGIFFGFVQNYLQTVSPPPLDLTKTCHQLVVTLRETLQTSAHFRNVALVFETFSIVSSGSHSAAEFANLKVHLHCFQYNLSRVSKQAVYRTKTDRKSVV